MSTLEELIAGAQLAQLARGKDPAAFIKEIRCGLDLVKQLGYDQSVALTSQYAYDPLVLSASTARTNVAFEITGDYIIIEHYPVGVNFSVKINDVKSNAIDLSKVDRIEGSFYKFYITNSVGNGDVVLRICRGLRIAPKTDLLQMSELATRLGAMSAYDRSGSVVWQDNFEGTQIKEAVLTAGVGAIVALTAAKPFTGDQCLMMKSGDANGNYASINQTLWLPTEARHGLSFAFRLDNSYDIADLQLAIIIYDGANYHRGALLLNVNGVAGATIAVYYMDSAGNWVKLSDWSAAPAGWPNRYHFVKLVVDYQKDKYVRAVVDNLSFDMKTLPLQVAAGATTAGIFLSVTNFTRAAFARTVWVDNLVVTQNEP